MKARALVAYLAITERPHPRGALAHLLWTDLPEADARNNLRVTLAALRKTLGGLILADRNDVGLDPDGAWDTDVRRFLEGLDRSEPEEVLAATDLYRGPLLDGLEAANAAAFHDWLATERDRLHGRATEALSSLARAFMDRNDPRSAGPVLRRLLELEPWLEGAHRELMRALAADGDREGALGQYERCRAILEEELGVAPSRATDELRDRIREGQGADAIALPHHNLPLPTTPLVGRDAEARELLDALRDPDGRIVTLTGPGGVGKTRLALDLAWKHLPDSPDGVFLIPLADVHDPAQVLRACAETLRLPSDASFEDLVGHLRDARMLLVWDNVEQVIDAAGTIARIAARCPSLTFLVTSREALNVRGERVRPVEPLGVPDGAEAIGPATLARAPSAALFVQRAREARPEFALDAANAADVAAVCRAVDGLPLALELAAARLRTRSIREVAEGFGDRFEVLRGGARDLPERHRALWAAIAWSDELLAPGERRLFHVLSVFAGGADPEAAKAVAGDADRRRTEELLGSLYAKSLLIQRSGPDGRPRFAMLESIRAYAAERLEASGEADAAREAHARWFHGLAVESEPHLRGSEQGRWEARLAAEYENLRAAESWLARNDPEAALDMVSSFWRFWHQAGRARVGLRVVREALARPGVDRTSPRYAYALSGAGNLALALGRLDEARDHHLAALELRRTHEDRALVATSLSNVAVVAAQSGDLEGARERMEQALEIERSVGDPWGVAASLHNLANVHIELDEPERAWARLEEALPIFRRLDDHASVLGTLVRLGDLAYVAGRVADVPELLERIEDELDRGVGDAANLVRPMIDLARSARACGEDGTAARILGITLYLADLEAKGRRLAGVLLRHAERGRAEGRWHQVAWLVGSASAAGVPRTEADAEALAELAARARRKLGRSAYQDAADFARARHEDLAGEPTRSAD